MAGTKTTTHSDTSAAKRLYISFGAMVLLLLLLVFIAYSNFRRLGEVNQLNFHTYNARLAIQQIMTDLVDMETGARGFMLTGERKFLEPLTRGQDAFARDFNQAWQLMATQPTQLERLRQIKQQQQSWLAIYQPLLDKRGKERMSSEQAMELSLPTALKRKAVMDDMRELVTEIETDQEALFTHNDDEADRLRTWTEVTLIGGGAFAVLLATMLATLLARSAGELINSNHRLLTEMSERERAEAKLRQSEEYFRSLIQNNQDIITIIDADGIIRYESPSVERVLGYTPEELVGKNAFDYVHPDDLARVQDKFKESLTNMGNANISEFRFRRKDGSWCAIETIGKNLLHDSAVQGFVVNSRDITERKQVERMKNEFISTVSHELRTPLTSIRGALGLLAGGVAGELPAKASSMIDIAHKNSERLVRLINDILDMEKIESGGMEFKIAPLELLPLIKTAIEANHAYADQLGVEFVLNSEVPDDVHVEADSDRLNQVLTNLLSNAAKFSPAGGTVAVHVARTGSAIRVSVADSGPGIPVEFQGRIFEKFAQADATDARQKGGTGLGLSISKAIVEKLGGRIGFNTQLGKGTTFFFELPESTPTLADAASLSRFFRESGLSVANFDTPGTPYSNGSGTVEESAFSQATNRQTPPRILICEDDKDVATLLGMMLQQNGFTTDFAYSAEEAKSYLQQHTYSGMTVDIALPGQDGISLIRDLRAQETTRCLPVVVVSARAEEGRAELNGDAIAIVDWLTKPIDVERLTAAASQAVENSRVAGDGKPRVLHVEDDPDVLRVIASVLHDTAEVVSAYTVQEAEQKLCDECFNLIILDLELPDGSGTRLLSRLHARSPAIPVLVFSASEVDGKVAQHVAAALTKSRTSNEQLLDEIKSLIHSKTTAATT